MINFGKRGKKGQARAEPVGGGYVYFPEADDDLCCRGYTRLSENPEILSGVNKIADLISSMTIHLMANSEKGDVRIKNELSRKLDINPNKYMTRKTFISALVRQLILEGDGNAVVLPHYKSGFLDDLVPIRPGEYSIIPDGYGYKMSINGVTFDPADVIHCVINPDPYRPYRGTGTRAALKDISYSLKQAAVTKRGFMQSKWKPSVIIKVDALTEEFSNKEGRKKLLQSYIETSEAGEPWLIPSENFEVEQIKPLSLNDIALTDAVKLDKRTAAAILDVPAFVLGEGSFSDAEWNNFVNTRIKALCNAIEQAFTRALLISPDMYFRFNIRSLYAYDIEKLSRVGDDNYTRGIMTGNEVRDWLGLSPKDGLDELTILENYIPRGMIGEQNKLKTE